jgi:predicted TIM-barrel fold metal-dependent hydrolase
VDFTVPANACDCHAHVVTDPAKFPMSAGRSYTPEPASPEELAALHRALHIKRVVLITPSTYGTDNSAMLFAMKALGANARGTAVIDDSMPERDLDAMDRAGVRGVRLNLVLSGQADPVAVRQRFQQAAKRAAGRGWHVQIYGSLAAVSAIKELVLAGSTPVVFDHFGGAQAALGVGQPGFDDLLALLRSGKAYVKVSGAYRASTSAPLYADVAPLAKAFIAANGDRVLWGTDWPHPDTTARPGHPPVEVSPFLAIDDGLLLNQLAKWAPDAAVRKKILVDNPAGLYRF